MKLYLSELRLALRHGEERIQFHDFTYFYGQMGAGKTSIARLVDYCLGGDLELSPALQSEFVSATLDIDIGDLRCSIERHRDSGRVRARWNKDGPFDLMIPARRADGVVLPGTEVEILSDLIYFLAGLRPVRVRRSKQREDSELGRLSLRDLLWYCYLDQDEIDSSFFHLERGADTFKRSKSRDVMRFVLGFHQERVAELESELEETRMRRAALMSGADALETVLDEVGVSSEQDIEGRVNTLDAERDEVEKMLTDTRERAAKQAPAHGVDALRDAARRLVENIMAVEDSITATERAIASDVRHRNEIDSLGLKIRRSAAARAVLSGVEFASCPRCTQALPARSTNLCHVCGQDDTWVDIADAKADVVSQDARARVAELNDSIERHETQLKRATHELGELTTAKAAVDRDLSRALDEYDSLYLSNALVNERRLAGLSEQIAQLNRLRRLPEAVSGQRREAATQAGRESEIRRLLAEARKSAEADTGNLERLEGLFLDCLLRARVPGIAADDRVLISPRTFVPEVFTAKMDDVAVTSFSNISSGGKKTLFKCCFAVALHRLAAEINATLPRFMIIDSPMKNISERENRAQFEGFHDLLYDLKASELADTQFVLIDKEFAGPNRDDVNVVERHMTPDNSEFPPLIPYYRGH